MMTRISSREFWIGRGEDDYESWAMAKTKSILFMSLTPQRLTWTHSILSSVTRVGAAAEPTSSLKMNQ